MARHVFGAGVADWAFTLDGDDNPVLAGGDTVTFWNARTGGSQYIDLSASAATAVGSGEFDHVVSSDGSDGYPQGTIPLLYGPDDVFTMWASVAGGSRAQMDAHDLDSLGGLVEDTAASLAAHISNVNGHGTSLGDLLDVDTSGVLDGDFIAWDTGTAKWVVVSGTGLNPADFIAALANTTLPFTNSAGAGGVAGRNTISIPDGDATHVGLQILIGAGSRGTAPNVFSVWVNKGTSGSPDWQETTRFNEFGELRGQASADDRVWHRQKLFSLSQTANFVEWTLPNNTPLAWVAPNGSGRFPNIGHTFAFSTSGNIATGTGKHRIYNDTGVTLTIRAIRASLGTAPVGSSAIFDVNKNGTTIFGTQANRPTIAAGGNTNKTTGHTVTTLADGDYLTIDVDQIGSGTAGADLVVQVLCS